MMNIYKELILENYRRPRNFGRVQKPDFFRDEENAFCGDMIEISGRLKKDKIKEIKFQGRGCVISQASSSILTEYVKNKSVKEIKKMSVKDMTKLLGVELSPTRMKCAELPLLALKKSLKIVE